MHKKHLSKQKREISWGLRGLKKPKKKVNKKFWAMHLKEPQNCAKAYNLRRDKRRILVFENYSLWLIPTDVGELCKNKERKRKVKIARA